MTWTVVDTASEAAARVQGRRFVSAELMYRPRPDDPRRRRVFDFTLDSRLRQLSRSGAAAALLVCDSLPTLESLAHLPRQYPSLAFVPAIVNPRPIVPAGGDASGFTPYHCGWDSPDQWRRYNMTDRWSRLLFALEVGRRLPPGGFLALPAHDAVWGPGLLPLLEGLSRRYAKNDVPAAVSPYTPYSHSDVPGAAIPRAVIETLNAAFGRDPWLRWRFRIGRYQAFWGKMGLVPFELGEPILRHVETAVWEDDLEMDRAIREAGYAARALWIDDPGLYRQALPVFDEHDLRRVIERALHYSLPIPARTPGEKSLLRQPLGGRARLRRRVNPEFARALARAEQLTAECQARIDRRLERCGVSWVDWGAYRYVARVRDPFVQVWKFEEGMLK